MAQRRPYPITLDERRLATQLSRSLRALRTAGSGHEDAFPRPELSARCQCSQQTFAATRGNGRDAPIAVLPSVGESGASGAPQPDEEQAATRVTMLSGVLV